jgi:hypothetical protein
VTSLASVRQGPVPAQEPRTTPPGGWPGLGSPANPPARPRPWPEITDTRTVTSLTTLGDAGPAAPRRIRWHFVGYPVVVAAAVAVGIAVGAGGGDGVRAAVTTGVATAAASAGDPAPAGVQTFGTTVTFEDGSTLTVGRPVPFTPEDVAFGGEDLPHHVKVKLTFVNNSDQVFDPSLTVGSVTSAGSEGEVVYQDDLDGPRGQVPPGKKITWWMGYGVTDAKDVTLTVRMGFLDYEDVTFAAE